MRQSPPRAVHTLASAVTHSPLLLFYGSRDLKIIFLVKQNSCSKRVGSPVVEGMSQERKTCGLALILQKIENFLFSHHEPVSYSLDRSRQTTSLTFFSFFFFFFLVIIIRRCIILQSSVW